jgi:hypothetical protein
MYTVFHTDKYGYKITQTRKKHVKNWYHKTPPNYKNNEKLNIFKVLLNILGVLTSSLR